METPTTSNVSTKLSFGNFLIRVHNHACVKQLPPAVSVNGKELTVNDCEIHLCQNGDRQSLLFNVGSEKFEYGTGFVLTIQGEQGQTIWPQQL